MLLPFILIRYTPYETSSNDSNLYIVAMHNTKISQQ